MFTGIIEELGSIKKLPISSGGNSELIILCQKIQSDLKVGDSVSVDGVCLTVTNFSQSEIVTEVSQETLKISLFNSKKASDKVNLERALRLSDRLGGHLVLGHVDSVSKIVSIEKKKEFYYFSFSKDIKTSRYLVHKGSVTVNGISLTISKLSDYDFTVAVIPHTFLHTNLHLLKKGDSVQIETDVIARYLEGLLSGEKLDDNPKGLSKEFLIKQGFDS